jgi:hypothetical protein
MLLAGDHAADPIGEMPSSAFEEWGKFLPDHSTAVSLPKRLLHHNNVVATDGESYRTREARSQSGGRRTKR